MISLGHGLHVCCRDLDGREGKRTRLLLLLNGCEVAIAHVRDMHWFFKFGSFVWWIDRKTGCEATGM